MTFICINGLYIKRGKKINMKQNLNKITVNKI